jgi:tetratricopeptide (TPR) repeat protein
MSDKTDRPAKSKPSVIVSHVAAKRIRDYRESHFLADLFSHPDSITFFIGPEDVPQESGFEYEVAEVERLFSEGKISVETGADRLGLTTREFLAEFVFAKENQQVQEVRVDSAAAAIDETKTGRSIRKFAVECYLNYAGHGAAQTHEGKKLLEALQSLPSESLGVRLRQALSVEYSLQEFVEEIFNQEWQTAHGVDDLTLTSLVSNTVSALQSADEYLLNETWFSALQVGVKPIPDRFVERLVRFISRRRFRDAKELLEKWDDRELLVSPMQKNAAILLSQYAQWIDFDFSYAPRVEAAIEQFRRLPRNVLLPIDSAHLDVAEGLINLHRENYNEAIVHFKYAMKMAHSVSDYDLLVICLYFISRAYSRKSLYLKALHYARRAKKRNEVLARPERGGAIEMREVFLLFVLGKWETAQERLTRAQKALRGTDDFGNAKSFEGRLYQASGDYAKALETYVDAIHEFQSCGLVKHRNIARTYINMADVRFLLARDLYKNGGSRTKVLELRLEAFENLAAAEQIYLQDPERNHRGLGKVHNMRAFLYQASGEFERAKAETELAYFFGSRKNDHLLMGKAKKNQWNIMTAARERKPATDDDVNDAIVAFASAEEALHHANQTNNRRLQARCHIHLGHSVLRLDRDYVRAQQCYDDARRCLTESNLLDQEHWQEKLVELQLEINRYKETDLDEAAELVY